MNTEHYRIPAGRELRVECSKNDPIKVIVACLRMITMGSLITEELKRTDAKSEINKQLSIGM